MSPVGHPAPIALTGPRKTWAQLEAAVRTLVRNMMNDVLAFVSLIASPSVDRRSNRSVASQAKWRLNGAFPARILSLERGLDLRPASRSWPRASLKTRRCSCALAEVGGDTVQLCYRNAERANGLTVARGRPAAFVAVNAHEGQPRGHRPAQ